MSKKQEDFLRELLQDFKVEADEHLHVIADGLLVLEKNIKHPDVNDIIEAIFRATHSLKGAARAVNLLQIEKLCRDLEGVFHLIKKGELALASSMFDPFYKVTDLLQIMLKEIDAPHKTISENDIRTLGEQLIRIENTGVAANARDDKNTQHHGSSGHHDDIHEGFTKQTIHQKTNEVSDTVEVSAFDSPYTHAASNTGADENETVRVKTNRLYDLMRLAEEMIAVRGGLSYFAERMEMIDQRIKQWISKTDAVASGYGSWADMRDKGDIRNELFRLIENDLGQTVKSLTLLERTAGRNIDEMIIGIKKTLMQPFSALFMVVPRIVRDLSKEYDKQIHLDIAGETIEIDRRILEEMKDPIIHLVRNCVDHGIELPEERLKAGKPAEGTLRLRVSAELSQKVLLTISDDGRGIQTDKLVQAAVKAGVMQANEAEKMDQKDKARLVFSSGLTTTNYITDLSGRGLGMSIVLEKLSKIGGDIDLQTEAGAGTTFLITLPRTLSTFKGVLARSSDHLFFFPALALTNVMKVTRADIITAESRHFIKGHHENIGLVSLADVLGLKKRSDSMNDAYQLVVVQQANKKMAFIVDEVLGDYEGVIKKLGKQLQHVNNVDGACIRGDGKIVLVLNIPELMDTASQRQAPVVLADDMKDEDKEAETPKRILVAEDSITVRNMLRNFLESAGFMVKTAVDGQQAFELLHNDSFDIVVSDVEMPRMNGFELTVKIKEDKEMAHIPVVLVTALESHDDRKRGLEAGASAYIVKSSFEKGNLVDAISRLA